jgi:hypothetical protein
MPRLRAYIALLLGALLVTGCTSNPEPTVDPTTPVNPNQSRTALPAGDTTVVDGDGAAALAVATSRAIFQSAPAVVLVAEDAEADLGRAGKAAVDLGVPLLLVPPASTAATAGPTASTAMTSPDAGTLAELTRLEARTIMTVGDGASAWIATVSTQAMVVPLVDSADGAAIPGVTPPTPLNELLVLVQNDSTGAAAAATARASGARVLPVGNTDPRASSETIKALAGQPIEHVLAVGSAFGPADQLRRRLATAATGVELPGGGQVLFPGRRMVALYGHPGDTVLGALGEQPVDAAIARAKQVAASYGALVGEPVVPTFEIITTVASSSAGADGNYSNESSIEKIRPWVDAARAAGVYVMLDLQPGRTDFLTQAKLYEELLVQPNVGLALDPEWRLKPGEVHMVQIGSVSVDEVNQVGQWLAQLTRDHNLPQKVLMLHQFRLDMISNRPALITSYDELKVVIHADGFGSPGAKFNTWNALHLDAPANVWWGWKNFYDEDKPTFTPQETYAVSPAPVFVSYQ